MAGRQSYLVFRLYKLNTSINSLITKLTILNLDYSKEKRNCEIGQN